MVDYISKRGFACEYATQIIVNRGFVLKSIVAVSGWSYLPHPTYNLEGQGVVFLGVSSTVQSSMVKIDVEFSIPTYNKKEKKVISVLFFFLSAEKR